MGTQGTPVAQAAWGSCINHPAGASSSGSTDILLLLDESWSRSFVGSHVSSLGSVCHPVRFNSVLAPEAPLGSQGSHAPQSALRKVHRLPVLLPDGGAAFRVFGGVFTTASPAGSNGGHLPAGVSKPVPIPGTGALLRQLAVAAPAHHAGRTKLEDMHSSVAGPAQPYRAVQRTAAGLSANGSWALRQIKHEVSAKQAFAERSPDSVLAARYGFVPAGAAAQAPAPPAALAFWPQAAGKGPHAAAAAQALQAAARKPPARVLFKPAARVAAPERPADAMGAAALATRLPGKQGHPAADELSAEERLWRLRAKRAWIREQLAAARGFPAAASGSYAEPWGEALDMVRAMGGAPDLQTAERLSFSGDATGLELHEDVIFETAEGGQEGAVQRIPPQAQSPRLGSTPSMESPVAGAALGVILPCQTSLRQPGMAQNVVMEASAIDDALPGNKLPDTIIGRAQELVRHQRSIEAAMTRAWRDKRDKGSARSAAGKQRRWMLRTDSAFDVSSDAARAERW